MNKTLPMIYEVTNPILSLLIISVLCFTLTWIYQLMVVFKADTHAFFISIIADNVRFISFLFTFLLIVTTMMIIHSVLKPFGQQEEHIEMLKSKKTMLMFEYQRECVQTVKTFGKQWKMEDDGSVVREPHLAQRRGPRRDSNLKIVEKPTVSVRQTKYCSIIDLYDHLIKSMECSTACPELLGIELTASRLLAVRGYIVGCVTVFAGTVMSNYFNTAYTDFSE